MHYCLYQFISVGLLSDIQWRDPDPEAEAQELERNEREVGWIVGGPEMEKFEYLSSMTFVGESHQLPLKRFEWFFGRKLVSV
jgi:hypothetical protein